MRFVFDTSAALALLFDEAPGAGLRELVADGCIGAPNLAETVTVMIRRGADPEQTRAGLAALALLVLNMTEALAVDAGMLWPATRSAGSSLGDRCALALSRSLGATLLTTDRWLAMIAPAAGVSVRLLQGFGAASAR